MKIVIVEDEVALSRALHDKFVRNGFEVVLVQDGASAIPTIKSSQPDIVALDLLLPKVNGFDVLAAIKSDPEIAPTPVIVLSNLGQDEDIKKALKLGADDFLVKSQHPINEVVEIFKNRLLQRSK